MKVKWQLYNSMGYLPKTDALDILLEDIEKCEGQIKISNYYLETNDYESLSIVTTTLRETLYYNIDNISDVMNALNYGFLNRLTGMVASDPILGLEVASKQFGGTQLIQNAAESLMKDYVECSKNHLFNINITLGGMIKENELPEGLYNKFRNVQVLLTNKCKASKEKVTGNWEISDRRRTFIIKNREKWMEVHEKIQYRGLVVFGFKNKAITHPRLIVHFPSYSEHDLEYLVILAHEAYHLTQSGILGITAYKMKALQKKIEKIILDEELTSLYYPETIQDKNTPKEIIAEELADEIMADIYATIVAGEAYPLILGRYYLPIVLDTNGTNNPAYSSFVIGSLKMRIATLALAMLSYESQMECDAKDQIRIAQDQIKKWETLSKHIALNKLSEKELLGQNLLNIDNKLDLICELIKKENIVNKMLDLIDRPYYPKSRSDQMEMQSELQKVKKLLIDEPKPKDIARIWESNLITPRNLISMLVLHGEDINRNALLIAIGYHNNILGRF